AAARRTGSKRTGRGTPAGPSRAAPCRGCGRTGLGSGQRHHPAHRPAGHLRGLDLSRLAIRGAYLQGVELQDTTLSGALLQESVFTETFDAITAVAISPDGQYWAAGRRGEVRLWREAGQKLHLVWQAHTDQV